MQIHDKVRKGANKCTMIVQGERLLGLKSDMCAGRFPPTQEELEEEWIKEGKKDMIPYIIVAVVVTMIVTAIMTVLIMRMCCSGDGGGGSAQVSPRNGRMT